MVGLYPLQQTTKLSSPESIEPRLYCFMGSRGAGCFWPSLSISVHGQQAEETDCKVNSKAEREMNERIQDPRSGHTQIRAHLKQSQCLWMMTRAFLYPAEREMRDSHSRRCTLGGCLPCPWSSGFLWKGRSRGVEAGQAGSARQKGGCPASRTCCPSHPSGQVTEGPVRGEPVTLMWLDAETQMTT